jgi:hypothetical protein
VAQEAFVFARAREMGLEGIVSKRVGSRKLAALGERARAK